MYRTIPYLGSYRPSIVEVQVEVLWALGKAAQGEEVVRAGIVRLNPGLAWRRCDPPHLRIPRIESRAPSLTSCLPCRLAATRDCLPQTTSFLVRGVRSFLDFRGNLTTILSFWEALPLACWFSARAPLPSTSRLGFVLHHHDRCCRCRLPPHSYNLFLEGGLAMPAVAGRSLGGYDLTI